MRLNKSGVLEVMKNGKMIHSDNLSLKYLRQENSPVTKKSQYSFVVSAKTAKLAVTRNLLKRQGREIVAKNSDKIKTPFNFIFFFKPSAVKTEYAIIQKEILFLLNKAAII